MKKLFSLLLVLALCLSLFPAAALAEDPAEGDVPGGPENEEATPPSPTQAPETPPLSGEASTDHDALAEEPAEDEPLDVPASGTFGDGLTWSLDADGTLTISGTGAMPDWSTGAAPWGSESSSIKAVRILPGVTSIGDYAFSNCSGLTTLTIPSSVTSVGDYVFQDILGARPELILIFLGDPPSFQTFSFGQSAPSCTALYPIGSGTWTADKLLDYGAGSMNWVGYRDQAVAYSVSYDPNGGSDAPIKQYKGHNVDLTLTSAQPVREGFLFLGWAEDAAAGEVSYASGSSYSANADLALYAVWQEIDPDETIVARGSCGPDLTWTYDRNGTLSIFGTGAMANWSSTAAPWYSYSESITEIILPEGLTSIGNHAFESCISLPGVTIPESVTCIGDHSFSSCRALTDLTVPTGVTSIGNYAFSDCQNLTDVTIPSSVARFGYASFEFCFEIQSVYIDDLDWWLGLSAVTGHDLPHGNLYLNGALVTEITVPEGTPSLRWSMFDNMTQLQRVTLPEGLTDIGNAAFSNCTGLTSLTIPDSVTSIRSDAFGGCTGLTSLTIPDSVTSIGSGAFLGCSSLTSLTIPEGVTSIGDHTFYNCSGLATVTLPDGLTSIGESAFYNCGALESLTIPSGVTRIGDRAFGKCYGLKTIFFRGNAPTMADTVFDSSWYPGDGSEKISATAYYPANNSTWTEAVRWGYGGIIFWKSYTPIDETVFPDQVFLNYVANNFDTDGDGYLTDEERAAVKVIDLGSADTADAIGKRSVGAAKGTEPEGTGPASLEGIQLFAELEELNAGGDFMTAGRLTRVDLSANTKLKILNLGFNPLEGLDVTMLPGLESLMVGFCGLTKLDLSGNPALKELWCDNNDLSELDLSANPLLEHLDCCGNEKLAVLDIRPCPSLVADYQAGGRHISWMQEEMPEMYESIWVYGGTGDDDYHLAVNSWTKIIAPAPAYTPGDINGDGALDNADVTQLIFCIKYGSADAEGASLDVNGDGELDNRDVTRLIRCIHYGGVDIF